ncbi:MAG TPA: hypothetical protein VFE41_02040 [Acetobacteraceae bacterium]|nr:hypothetical protein [Acetobacteraceae bacterium]
MSHTATYVLTSSISLSISSTPFFQSTNPCSTVCRHSRARPNQSFAAVNIEVIRVLNSFHIQNGGGRNMELRDWYMAHARTFDLSELFSAIGSNIALLRFSDASSAVVRLHDAVLAAYAGVLVDPVRKGCLFEVGTSEIRVVQPRYLTNRAARAALDKVYAAFLQASCRTSGDLPAD